jgi:predicted nucleic acid-binding Zn ribbon protein
VAFAALGQEIRELSKKLGLSTDLAIIEHAWRIEVGNLREMARIVALDNTFLVVEVDSHAAMQELSLRRRELVRKINKHLPDPFLRNIMIRITQNDGR